jgi:hypothetical protein
MDINSLLLPNPTILVPKRFILLDLTILAPKEFTLPNLTVPAPRRFTLPVLVVLAPKRFTLLKALILIFPVLILLTSCAILDIREKYTLKVYTSSASF